TQRVVGHHGGGYALTGGVAGKAANAPFVKGERAGAILLDETCRGNGQGVFGADIADDTEADGCGGIRLNGHAGRWPAGHGEAGIDPQPALHEERQVIEGGGRGDGVRLGAYLTCAAGPVYGNVM